MGFLISHIGRGVLVRVFPGLINIGALLFIASQLGADEFGLYSTGVAIAGFIASLLFGPVTFSTVTFYALHYSNNNASNYEYSVYILAFFISLIICIASFLTWLTELTEWEFVAASLPFGIFTLLLEFPRARMEHYLYGLISMIQSTIFLLLSYVFLGVSQGATSAIYAYSCSYLIAGSVILCINLYRIDRNRHFDLFLLKDSLTSGSIYTVSIIIENGLYVGMRVLVLLFSSPHALSVFSFSVDLAQRTIGVFANIASFSLVPLAFKRSVQGSTHFTKTLSEGGLIVLFVSFLLVAGVEFTYHFGGPSVPSSSLFDGYVFFFIALAVCVNRLKKLMIDPVALRKQRGSAIVLGFLFSSPLSLLLAYCYMDLSYLAPPIIYFLGYVLAFMITAFLLYREFTER
jgi:O-antigen/teichoic acid export membrane protein